MSSSRVGPLVTPLLSVEAPLRDTNALSASVTDAPISAARMAAHVPANPPPMTTTSEECTRGASIRPPPPGGARSDVGRFEGFGGFVEASGLLSVAGDRSHRNQQSSVVEGTNSPA